MKFLRSGLIVLTAALLSGIFYFQTVFASPINQANIIELTNQTRIQNGLPPLSVSSKLTQAAENKAKDIEEKNYWSHNTPDGKPFWSFADQVGYNWSFLGENLAANFKTSEGANAAWLLSSTHRKNILNYQYNEVGIGIDNNIVVVLYGRKNKSIIDKIQELPYILSRFLIFDF